MQILHQADFTIPVEIEGNYHNVYVIKRPGVDEFMKRVGELYEVVVFTAGGIDCFDSLLACSVAVVSLLAEPDEVASSFGSGADTVV